nr:glutamate--tRNA ligase family protein [Helicobacter bizzozeronii]
MVVTRFAPSPTGHLHIGGQTTILWAGDFNRGEWGLCLFGVFFDGAESIEPKAQVV